ncbi:MAG: Rpn family recombination-promoting nuclease/putative transposase [Chlamydiae bacterium]|nr:Rpn family recombination-promoting nuclease/putative transposase [Chlamydiota bacterium]
MSQINPRVDLAFKKIFGSLENKDLLISFINSVVSKEDQVVDIELLNPYNPKNFAGDKLSVLDIKAKDTKGNYYNIEVQISNEADYDKRALYYWAKLYSQQLTAGLGYKHLRKAIGIHVLNFISIANNPKYINKFIISNEETKERYFADMELYTIELCKFTQDDNENLDSLLPRIKNGLDRWAAFLTKAYYLDRNNLPKELDDPCIKKAIDVLQIISFNKEERDFYEGHLKWLMIEESILDRVKADATAEGIKEGIKIVARNLIASGTPVNVISEFTGLSKEEIQRL